jgi:hypothetical protein
MNSQGWELLADGAREPSHISLRIISIGTGAENALMVLLFSIASHTSIRILPC